MGWLPFPGTVQMGAGQGQSRKEMDLEKAAGLE